MSEPYEVAGYYGPLCGSASLREPLLELSGPGFERVVGQRLAQRPHRARHAVRIGDDGAERRFDPRAIIVRDHQRRQELDGGTAMARDLDEDLVRLEQRQRDQLAEEALVHR